MQRAAILFFVTVGGCADLPDIPAGTCGNHVVEAGEDCDGLAPGSAMACISKGSVGECHLDCGRGSDGRRPDCPADWGCNLQGICRPSAGAFEASSKIKLGGAWSLATGDFDGDGRAEVLSLERPDIAAGTKLQFHYFDETGALAETRAFPKRMVSPVVVPHPGTDSRSDLVFIDPRLAVSVLPGQTDRSLVPESFASYYFRGATVRILPVGDAPIGDSSAIVMLTSIGGVPGLYVPADSGILRHAGELPGALGALVGEPASGNLIEDRQTSPCRELVLAARDATSFSIIDTCTRTGATIVWRDRFLETIVDLVPPAPIDVAPVLVDLDGDGHLDVLIGAAGKTYVAMGDGRELGSAVPFQLEVLGPVDDGPRDTPMPLAAGDVTGDGAADLVFGNGLLLSAGAAQGGVPLFLPGPNHPGAPWTVAVIADLNGNGKVDVAAASRDGVGVDFLNGTGTSSLFAFSIPTDAPVEFLVATDLDGDLIDDLAFTEPSRAETERDGLFIAFGSPAGPPAAPTPVARIARIEELSALVELGVGNLTVASTETGADGPTGVLAVLSHSGDRLPSAPYELVSISPTGAIMHGLAAALTVGPFTAPGRADVMALASGGSPQDNDYHFWLLPPLETAEGPASSVSGQIDPRLTPVYSTGSDIGVSLTAAAADVDGDGRAEALWVMPADDRAHCGLVVVGAPADGAGEVVVRSTLVIEEPCLRPQFVPVDADGDGHIDLALLTGGPGAPERKILVLWNDGTGGFGSSALTILNAAAESPEQFTVLPATASHAIAFAYVTDRAALEVDATSSGGRTFGPPRPLLALEGGSGIVAADVNGDRVTDLVLAASGNLLVLQAGLVPP